MIPSDIVLEACNESDENYRVNHQNVGLGVAYFSLGTFYVILYIPCLIVMLKKELWSNVCYKLMFFVGIFDIGTMMTNAFLPGIIMVFALDYNCYPNLNQIIMDIWSMCWNPSCCMVVALAINRYVFITSPVWSKRLYGGKRVLAWMVMSLCFGLAVGIAYRTKYATMIIDSKLGLYEWPSTDEYGQSITFGYQVTTSICLIIPYVLTLKALRTVASALDMGSDQVHRSNAEKRTLLQVMIICTLTITTCVMYPVLPRITENVLYFQILHVIWISTHGINGIVYLTLNNTIQKQVSSMFGYKQKRIVPLGPTGQQC